MEYSFEEINRIFRTRHKEMQPLYDAAETKGTKAEIPWEGHLPVKVFLNYPASAGKERYPVFLHLHGGAFAEGDAVTMDSFCQKLADTLGILVVNINYRLFPEVRFPYQIEETLAVFRYLKTCPEEFRADPGRIAAGGFSAGAQIALGAAIQMAEDKEERFRCIVCGYPVVSAVPEDADNSSEQAAADDELSAAMAMCLSGWEKNPLCSALYGSSSILKKIGPVILITCGKDSLGKQGEAFKEKLTDCGARVLYRKFEKAYHGFIEVNRKDYFLQDPRKNEEQLGYTKEAEEFIIRGLKDML